MPKKNYNVRIEEHPILNFENKRLVKFYFEGKEYYGYEGESVAAALIANGIKIFYITKEKKRKRGFFCAIGRCSSCLIKIDGKKNVMACIAKLKERMRIERQ